jgi:hypothetical protein
MSHKLDSYTRKELLELVNYDKPMIVAGRYISPVTPEDAYAATFVRVKPYCPGYRTHEIANHINFVRSDVEKYHHFDMEPVASGFIFPVEFMFMKEKAIRMAWNALDYA